MISGSLRNRCSLRVTDFPTIVTMDAHGNSLHADVESASAKMLATLAESVF